MQRRGGTEGMGGACGAAVAAVANVGGAAVTAVATGDRWRPTEELLQNMPKNSLSATKISCFGDAPVGLLHNVPETSPTEKKNCPKTITVLKQFSSVRPHRLVYPRQSSHRFRAAFFRVLIRTAARSPHRAPRAALISNYKSMPASLNEVPQ